MRKSIICKSGIRGWRMRLREVYSNHYESWIANSAMFGLKERLGYKTHIGAWRANPIIQGSVNAKDFQKSKNQNLK